jgi:hypothetical protein
MALTGVVCFLMGTPTSLGPFPIVRFSSPCPALSAHTRDEASVYLGMSFLSLRAVRGWRRAV